MSPTRTRLALALGSAGAAALCVWLAWPRADPALFEVETDATATLDLLREHAEGASPAADAEVALPEDAARRLFTQLQNRSNRYDPHCFFRYRAHLDQPVPYPEHPDGAWRLVTNALGLRMDAEVLAEPPDARILVTGDSHTDGICNNAEGFPALLAGSLAGPARTVEVLNAGKSGYSLYQYRGVLDTFANTEPDLFVVCLYGGNDFAEVLTPYHWLERVAPEIEPIGPERLAAARDLVPRGVLPQYLMQAGLLRANPDLADLARRVAADVTRDLDRRCRERGLRWVGVYVPPLVEVRPDAVGEGFEEAEGVLGLGPADRAWLADAADGWLALLEELEVPRVDLRPVLRADPEPLYWRQDHHLNLRANRLVADALADALRPLLAD